MCECKPDVKNHVYEFLHDDYYIHTLLSREKTLEHRILKTKIIIHVLKPRCSFELNAWSRTCFPEDFLNRKAVALSCSGFTLSLHYRPKPMRNQKQKLIGGKSYTNILGGGERGMSVKYYFLQYQFSTAWDLHLPKYSYKKAMSDNPQCW